MAEIERQNLMASPQTGTDQHPVAQATGAPQFRQVELKNAGSLWAKVGCVPAFLSSGPWN
jgi:hypothetical protein